MRKFLASAKEQINKNLATMPIFIAPIYGEPPFYDLPKSMTYQLDRMVGAPDIRFFDKPHRYFAIFKLPFIFFYIPSKEWLNSLDDKGNFSGTVKLSDINKIPDFIRKYILSLNDQFESSKDCMSRDNLKNRAGYFQNKKRTGAHKSISRSRQDDQS